MTSDLFSHGRTTDLPDHPCSHLSKSRQRSRQGGRLTADSPAASTFLIVCFCNHSILILLSHLYLFLPSPFVLFITLSPNLFVSFIIPHARNYRGGWQQMFVLQYSFITPWACGEDHFSSESTPCLWPCWMNRQWAGFSICLHKYPSVSETFFVCFCCQVSILLSLPWFPKFS